jgi:PKD repeat protein
MFEARKSSLLCGLATALVGVSLLSAATATFARSNYLFEWSEFTYPLSRSDNNAGCALCHLTLSGSGYNGYGTAIRNQPQSLPLETRFRNVEPFNSDGDPGGYSNLAEITASTQPGWKVGDAVPTGVTGDLDPTIEPPVADANGPYSGLVDEVIAFDGTGSTDPDGTIVSYAWTFGDGATGTGPTPTHAYAAAGTYAVGLVVTDNDGLPGSASSTATIEDLPPPPQPPIADANGPYTAQVGETISFDGTGSTDPDGTIVSYFWTFGDGATGTGATPTHAYAVAGVYPVTLTVTDDDGLTDGDLSSATITEAPPVELPPVADANGPYVGTVGTPVDFDGTGSTDPNGNDTIVSYDWDFGDGSTGTGATPSHTYTVAGTYTVELTVTDETGLTDTDTSSATIADVGPFPPTADANGPYTGVAGIPVTFDASGSTDPDDDIASYTWDFGDGTVVTVATAMVDHTYAAEGVYDVNLTVTDSTGLSDGDATSATIYPAGSDADVFLTRVVAPANVFLRVDTGAVTRRIGAAGDGDTIEQLASVTLTSNDPDGLTVVIDPATIDETVVPGSPQTQFIFDATISCQQVGVYELVWTATIDAAQNADPTNDTAEGVTVVDCRRPL